MTIQRAREILGDEIESLSDSEIQAMIDRDFRFCDALLDVIMTSNDVSGNLNFRILGNLNLRSVDHRKKNRNDDLSLTIG